MDGVTLLSAKQRHQTAYHSIGRGGGERRPAAVQEETERMMMNSTKQGGILSRSFIDEEQGHGQEGGPIVLQIEGMMW